MVTLKNYAHQNLAGTDFSGVDLSEADLSNSNLQNANFAVALLKDANLAFADMAGVNIGETQAFQRSLVSPDGQVIASSSGDRLVRLWDTKSRREIRILKVKTSSVQALAFSPDGRLLATTGGISSEQVFNIQIWDVKSGREQSTLQGHTDAVLTVAFSPDGRFLASGGGDKNIRLWDVKSGRERSTLQGHTDAVHTVVFSADGRFLASCSNKSVRLWEINSGRELWVSLDTVDPISDLKIDLLGKFVFLLAGDLFALEIATGKTALTLPGHTGSINSLVFSPNKQLLASASSDKTVRLWDLKSGREQRVLYGHTDIVHSVAFSPDGRVLASGGDKTIRLWDIENGQQIHILSIEISSMQAIAFSPDGQVLAAATGGSVFSSKRDASIRLWDVATGQEIRVLQSQTTAMQIIAFSPDGQVLAATARGNSFNSKKDHGIRLWNVSNGQELHVLQGHTDFVNSLAFSPDGRVLASGSRDKTVRLWDLGSGREQYILEGHTASVLGIIFESDGQIIISRGADKTIRFWEVATGSPIRVLEGQIGSIAVATFSADGEQIAAAGGERTTKNSYNIQLWKLNGKEETRSFEGRPQPKAFEVLDNNQIAVGTENGYVELWQLDNLQKINTYRVHTQTINDLSYNSRIQKLVSGSNDKSLAILDLSSGEYQSIKQELHCLRANIFGVRGLREDQKALMLRKGAVEINPLELPSGWQTKDTRQWVRNKRIQNLANQITQNRKTDRGPIVLLIGPGTFLADVETQEGGRIYELERLMRRPIHLSDSNLADTQQTFWDLYERLQYDDDYQRYIQKQLPDTSILSKDARIRDRSSGSRENYSALIQLANERFFNLVVDFDFFSQLDRTMFSSTLFDTKYSELEDIEYSLHRLSRDWRYLEKGQTLFLKYFSDDLSSNIKRTREERRSYQLRRLFDEIFERMFYEFEGNVTIIWTGFYIREIASLFERFSYRSDTDRFFWVIDESIRDTTISPLPAIYLDYPMGHFSDLFRDLYQELGFSERSLHDEFQDADITNLRKLAQSDQEENRSRVANEIIARLASTSKRTARRGELRTLVLSLRTDLNSTVRQSVLQGILQHYARLSKDMTELILEFAKDSDDSIRADVARWIISQYNEFGKTYEALLNQLAQDKSAFVHQTIVDTIKQRFELLPSHIRLLASQLVGVQIDVQMIKGSGMLVGEPSSLHLRITNLSETNLQIINLEIIESAEYQVLSTNPTLITSLEVGSSKEAQFQLKMKVPKQIAVNYRVNGELKEPPLYINAIRDNPYVYGDPVKDDLVYFGRKDELEQIIQAVTKPTKQDILIVGERRTGKTSLIYQLVRRLDKPFIPVYIALNTSKPTTESVLTLVLSKIAHTLVEHGLLSEQWKRHQFQHQDFEDSLKEIMDAVKINLSDAKLIVFLDEADYLLKVEIQSFGFRRIINSIRGKYQIDERLQNILRAALQSTRVGTDFRAVVAGTTDLSSYISERSSPFFNHFKFVNLEPLTSNEINDLITRPASILGYTYSPTAIKKIMQLSGGQPYYCQALCYEAFGNALKEERFQINDRDVDIAEKKGTKDLYNGFRSYFWNRTTKLEKHFLDDLACGSVGFDTSEAQVKRLLDWGIVLYVNNKYQFSCGLIEKWTKMLISKE